MQRLHHVGYWVDDLDSALTRWNTDLGVGPFQVIEHVPFEEFVLIVDGQRYDDVGVRPLGRLRRVGAGGRRTRPGPRDRRPPRGRVRHKPGRDGINPGANGANPGAVSHVSWVVPDITQESARLARLGCRLINTARSGPISVAWHHGGPLFPHPIELHQHNDVIAGMHDRLVALRPATTANTFGRE